jgi:hypothetical protein
LVVAVFTIKYEMIGSVSLLLLCDEWRMGRWQTLGASHRIL